MQNTTVLFPKLEARNLEGRNFNLPGDFEGEVNVALVAFKMWHQSLVDSWLPRLKALVASNPMLRVYELPTIATPYIFMRWMIDGGMTAAIPDKQVRETTLTIYTNIQRVTDALNITSTETISLFLVNRSGRIFWRGQGGFDEAQMAELERVVRDGV